MRITPKVLLVAHHEQRRPMMNGMFAVDERTIASSLESEAV